MKNTEYKGHVNPHVMTHLNIKPKRKIQWDILLFYLIVFFFAGYIVNHITKDILSLSDNDNIKTEYKIELISNDSIKIYSKSSDTVYNTTIQEFHEIVHIDNL